MKSAICFFLIVGLSCIATAQSQQAVVSDSKNETSMQEAMQKRMKQYEIYKQMYAQNPLAAVDSVNQETRKAGVDRGKERLEKYLANLRPDTLEVIDLSNAGLTEIPDWVWRGKRVKTLILDDNHIRKLPKELGLLDSLKWVSWRANDLAHLKWVKMERIENVQTLDISNNLLEKIPGNLKKMEGLKELIANENFFGKVPVQDLKRASRLKSLILNKSHELSLGQAHYEKLDSLEVFKANGCRLTEVHPDFYKMPALKELQLQQNEFISLPDGISQLTELEKLSLYQNKLKTLPADLFDLNLKIIDLYYNQLEIIPDEICRMTDLEVLFLANNSIYYLPDCLGDLLNLEALYLHHNRLSVLPQSVAQLTKLKVIRVNDNYLMEFPYEVLELGELEDLDISANEIPVLPLQLAALAHLKLFTYQKNPIDFQLPENSGVGQMIFSMMEEGVTCVPGVYVIEDEED